VVRVLRSFRLENHRSFRDEHELLLMPAYAKDREALPVAAIYGANASGKSNLLDGLKFMAEAVRDSFARWGPDAGVVGRCPFKLDAGKSTEPSVYVAELIQDGVRYTYGFEVDSTSVLGEWLYSYPEKRKRMLFERAGSDIKFGSTVDGSKAALAVLESMLRPNSLLLSLAAQLQVSWLLPVYRWFADSVRFRVPSEGRALEHEIADFLQVRPELKGELVELVRAADVGIDDIVVGGALEELFMKLEAGQSVRIGDITGKLADTGDTGRGVKMAHFKWPDGFAVIPYSELLGEAESSVFSRSNAMQFIGEQFDVVMPHKSSVRVVHRGGADPFRLDEESAGTRSWLSVLPAVLSVLRDGGCLVIDAHDAPDRALQQRGREHRARTAHLHDARRHAPPRAIRRRGARAGRGLVRREGQGERGQHAVPVDGLQAAQ
jgi:hypothetical protein